MRGLDPRIHPSSQESLSKWLDCRVKPGNDGGGYLRPNSFSISLSFNST